MKPTVGERIFYACNTVFLIAVALLCIAPMVHILAVSFSANDMVTSGQVTFWPKQLHPDDRERVLKEISEVFTASRKT